MTKMNRRAFMQTVGISAAAFGVAGSASACKHKHGKRKERRANKHNLAPHTKIIGDSWRATESFGMKEYAITGEVKWTGRFPAEMFITATFYDKRGTVLSSDGIASLSLAPGEIGGFQIDYLNENAEEVGDYKLATEVFRQ
ncbi:FxLYD domain-containing protein [Haladaptatus caseinilyticus]|uniref:FxLYD domain-containing protein n=1 Tax=Haladaptatus caseinilyticus TaxID=2993314 RepID=UPI00224AE5D2|nr:FxLYD domain-containing protein [Haladaptatus caseinilyticus]